MRQRKIKNIEEKLAEYGTLLVSDPESNRGKWRQVFDRPAGAGVSEAPPQSLYAEIGCGKGRFITESALRDDQGLYLAFEGNESVLYRALQRACAGPEPSAREIYEAARAAGPELAPKNLRFIRSYIEEPTDFFAEGELDGIYLNYSDPWPKARQEKRRLTSPQYLAGYQKALKPGGFLRFKTDNEALFAYSTEKIKEQSGFKITKQTDDLQNTACADAGAGANIETEYERKFRNLRRPIHFIEAVSVQIG
jgi:tRNA (guanine-N7-)-methyltransferase